LDGTADRLPDDEAAPPPLLLLAPPPLLLPNTIVELAWWEVEGLVPDDDNKIGLLR